MSGFQPGDRISDYEVLGVLGAGGMGKVYKVRNVLSDRVEAMKVLLPGLGEEGELTDRFIREIKVSASLEHPNIAALRTAQKVGGQVLMIMELVEGSTIDAKCKNGPLPLKDALDYMSQVLGALEYAHERGIVHRDIKPSNMMVTPNGTVKLMDFGIAKLHADRKLTMTGRTIGSLYYMSPEQIQGAASVDARSDLYSLGICIYEIVTGQRPFGADSDYALMVAHLELMPPPPIQIDPKMPQALNDIILMAIAKDPLQRFQTAGAFRAAVNNVRRSIDPQAVPPPPQIAVAAAPAPALNVPRAPIARPAPPPPMPVMAPLPPPPAPAGSRRGLYMALGSIITVAVLAFAVIEGPKLFAPKQAAGPGPAPAPQTPAAQTPPSNPLPDPNQQTPLTPGGPGPAQQQAQSGAAPPPAVTPPQQPRGGGRTTAPSGQPSSGSGFGQPGTPRQPQPQPPANSPPPQTPQHTDPAPVKPTVNAAELNEAREQYNQLAIRAGTAKSGLQSLQNQMGRQGLRADMREAAVRMDYLMGEAMTSIRSGNIENAKRNMEMADRVIETIEKFLGR